jgi:ketosteroid isomerase-like protein
MPETVSPSDLFRRIVEAVAQRRQSEILDDYYAEDVVVEHPFMIPEPTTTWGREQLRKRMTSLKNLPITMEIGGIVVHETTDPEVIIGEFESHVTSTVTGARITTGNILVLRVRNGRVISSRDYHHHARLAEFMASQQ